MPEDKYRRVNPILDKEAYVGPFPPQLLLPAVGFFIGSYIIFVAFLRLPWVVGFGVWVTLTASYWIFIRNGIHIAFGPTFKAPFYISIYRPRRNILKEADNYDHQNRQTTKTTTNRQSKRR